MNKSKQKLELTWIGKDDEYKDIEPRILVEVPEKSYGDKSTENMLVHGDNLLALKALEQDYTGKIKCIYIDPPYNTGSAFEHYDDNTEHSRWLTLIKRRLEILYNLLSDDGSIWISIDDREAAYLKVLCDEVFDRKNFVSAISWQRTYSPRNDAKGISSEVEKILVYSKKEGWSPNKLPRTAKMDSKYKNPDNDISPWRTSDAFAPEGITHQGMVYAIQHPITGEMLYPYKGAHWPLKQSEMLSIMNEWCNYELKDLDDDKERADVCGISVDEIRKGVLGIVLSDSLETARNKAQAIYQRGQWPRFFFTKMGQGGIARKTYLKNTDGRVPTNLWLHDETGHTDEAKKEVKMFNSESIFATPKPERLIERVLTLGSNKGDLVLDSFLGSGTTAAVAHKMGRKWIGIELGDHCYTHCEPRLHQVVDGTDQGGISKAVEWKGGGGYKFYELAPSLLKKDEFDNWIIEPKYDAEMLAEAMAKHEGYKFSPDENNVYKQGYSTEKDFIFTTTQFLSNELLNQIHNKLEEGESLLICATHFEEGVGSAYSNITVKKIPQMLLNRCEFGRAEYNLNIIEEAQPEDVEEEILEDEE